MKQQRKPTNYIPDGYDLPEQVIYNCFVKYNSKQLKNGNGFGFRLSDVFGAAYSIVTSPSRSESNYIGYYKNGK